MANIEVSKQTQPAPHRFGDVVTTMRHEMDRMFERFEHGFPRWPVGLSRGNGGNGREFIVPELDVHDDGKQLMIEADLPGIDEKDVSVTLTNGMLTIKGERKAEHEESQDDYYLCERSYGAFERSLRLPDSIDEGKVEARFDKGVLKVIAPKRPEAVKAEKKIEIKKG